MMFWLKDFLEQLLVHLRRRTGERQPHEIPIDCDRFGAQTILIVPEGISLLELMRLKSAWEKGWRPACIERHRREEAAAQFVDRTA